MVEPGQYLVPSYSSSTKNPKINNVTTPTLSDFDKRDRELSEKSFKTVSRKNAAKPRTVETKTAIETSNKFQHLMDAEDQNNLNDPQKIFIPAINLKLTDDYNLTLQEISRNHPETINKYNREYIKISPNSLEDRDKIIEYLNKSDKEYVLSEAPDARPVKIVIKNLPPDHCKEKISQELEENNFKVVRINQLRNFRLKTFHPIFLVELLKTPNVNDIYKIDRLNLFKVKIEHYRKKNRATMCFNCSEFFHSARNCRCKPRCIKCNGSHETRLCQIKTKIDNPTFINFNETGHLASWRGCPKYPIIKPNKLPTHTPKLKSNINKPEKPQILSIPNIPNSQSKSEDFSDFQRNFNAMRIINDAFKRFPNLIEISEKKKLAKNDTEILNLLLQSTNNYP
ncbi:hypothetical protein AVEN_226274-1 [Araneus ventricosus]|uniref:Pre-C2HC domain-containing protein n=1 Tax=Araneus ventricosus TaxID=182803 RepID=A0A4Y2DB22_ARAVE|nr:hypothetical protein AVEN_226274-1 [Araneus ventricosus]